MSALAEEFLSTLPARGATCFGDSISPAWLISIHAPREGSDSLESAVRRCYSISIHAPREGSD